MNYLVYYALSRALFTSYGYLTHNWWKTRKDWETIGRSMVSLSWIPLLGEVMAFLAACYHFWYFCYQLDRRVGEYLDKAG